MLRPAPLLLLLVINDDFYFFFRDAELHLVPVIGFEKNHQLAQGRFRIRE